MTNKIIGVIVALLVIGGVVWVLDQRSTTIKLPATSTPTETPVSTPSTPTSQAYTAAMVATHNSVTSCWTIIGSNVYDVTTWISKHPGGRAAILGTCGIDATVAFTRQHGSSAKAQAALATFLIGSLNS